MLNFLLRRFVPDCGQCSEPAVRRRCGTLAGALGIALNLLLFAGKLAAGLLTGAISVTADALNNLTDAASSVVTLVGFRLAGQKPDAHHPFGHGRLEYLAGLAISLIILLVGLELGRSSILRILRPEPTRLSPLTAGILVLSILVKLWLGRFNRLLGRRIHSEALHAAAVDARCDAIATSAVLLGLVISRFTSFSLDGWIGILVSLLILWAGISSAKATLDPLLGQAPDPAVVRALEELILSHGQILGIHDMVIHDYGPGRRMMSVHAEVPCSAQLLSIHEVIDHIEREIEQRFSIEAVIHMDPIQTDDPAAERLRRLTLRLIRKLHPSLTIHDFRITADPPHTMVSFHVVVPYELPLSDEDVRAALSRGLAASDPSCRAVIGIDRFHVR